MELVSKLLSFVEYISSQIFGQEQKEELFVLSSSSCPQWCHRPCKGPVNMVYNSHPTMNRPPPLYATVHPDENARIPVYQNYGKSPYGRPRRSGNCCLRCICCCYCFLFILIIVLAGLSLYFYTILKPQVPSYNVHSIHVKNFEPLQDLSLKTEFIVNVEANNPNSHISLIYGKGSKIVLWYKDHNLSQGELPSFRQGTNNITTMHIDMNGKTKLEPGLQEALREDQKNKMVPMIVEVQAPISVVVGKFKLREFVVYVNCSLELDSLSPKKKPNIISSTYTIRATL